MSDHTRAILATTCLWGFIITLAYAGIVAVTIGVQP